MFGFTLGGSAEKSKTTTNGAKTFTNTTTRNVPQWGADLVQKGAARVDSFVDMDPEAQAAPANPLLTGAAKSAADLSGRAATDPAWLKPYMTADTPFASGGKAYDFVDRYLNPYLKDVVDASAADFDSQAGKVRAQQSLDLAGSGAFGGSGAALTQSMTEGELSRSRASTLSGLRSRAYDTAVGAAAGDADRATQARISNAQMRLQDQGQKVGFGFQDQQHQLAAQENARANIATQAGLGQTLRGIDQDLRGARATNAQQVVALLSGLPLDLFSGTTVQGASTETGTSKTKGVKVSGSVSGSISGGPANG